MRNEYVESIASSLVREYLSRKGFKMTLQVLDEEFPRQENTISNRLQLIKELGIEKIMKKNKEIDPPLRAMLEVIAKYLLEVKLSSDGVDMSTESGSSRPSSSAKLRSGENTDRSVYDGFPVAQRQDDGGKADMTQGFVDRKTKPRSTKSAKDRGFSGLTYITGPQSQSNDLVIEESTEGETLLGEGKSGVMEKEELPEQPLPQKTIQTRPRSAKHRGLSGPITSSVEDTSKRKFHKPRPLSSAGPKNSRLNFEDSNSKKDSIDLSSTSQAAPILERSDSSESKKSVNSILVAENKLDVIDTLISKPIERKPIQDVLSIEPGRPKTASRRQNSVEKEVQHYSVQNSSIAEQPKKRGSTSTMGSRTSSSNSLTPSTSKVGDVEIGDVDDLESDLANVHVAPVQSATKILQKNLDCKPIDVKTAMKLKSLILGSANQCFSDEWRLQSFSFCDIPGLKYGIVQKKGGPCGVLAAVQAGIVQELLFGGNKIPSNRFGNPCREERSNALATALSKIFWRAGENHRAIVALSAGRSVITGAAGKFKTDELIETLNLYTFKDYEELSSFMKQSVSQFEVDGGSGVVLSLYSIILSRTEPRVRSDMDEPTNKLMGAHGYCTQDMVNLYLTGRAVSNVFNDVMELDSGEGQITLLKGINSRCDIGLLSLFEHYKSCQVGTYLKTPRFPIWVVCSESHFSVLFTTRKELVSDWKAELRFDLYYYDGLARQEEEIKLTITTTNKHYKPPSSEEELVPPLEHCIRTKWTDAEIDWNDTEPLL